MTHPSHAHFLLFCEEDLPSGMFLSGGRLITFLDSAKVILILTERPFHASNVLNYKIFQASKAFLK